MLTPFDLILALAVAVLAAALQGSVGFGLRIGLPPGTRNIWRADVVFPVGSAGESPMFRLTFELNKFRSGFFNPEVRRSYWFGLGPETF